MNDLIFRFILFAKYTAPVIIDDGAVSLQPLWPIQDQ